jgi:hypothetical protein
MDGCSILSDMTTSSSYLVALMCVGLAAAGCSSGGDSGPSPFNGTWSCTGSTSYKFTMPVEPTFTEPDAKSTLVFDIDDGQPITITSLSTTNAVGGAGCSLTYSTSGGAATLDPNQSCTIKITSGATVYTLDVSYGAGSASVTGTTIAASHTDTFTGTAVKGSVSTMLAGTISGSKTCTN